MRTGSLLAGIFPWGREGSKKKAARKKFRYWYYVTREGESEKIWVLEKDLRPTDIKHKREAEQIRI